VASVPKPVPDEKEVSVRVKAVAINPVDYKQFYYGFMIENWPATFGVDGAGIVESVGQGVSRFKAGDEVFGLFGGGPKGAAFQEVATVPEASLALKPKNLSFEDAASLPVPFSTAASAIFTTLGISIPHLTGPSTAAGAAQYKSILVLGGSSSVGSSAVELLRRSLPSATIIATSSLAHSERLKSLGATAVVDYKTPTLVADIKAATPDGKGVDAIIDTVASGASEAGIFDVLRPDGPKKVAEIATGAQIQAPAGVTKELVFGRSLYSTPGGENTLNALGSLIAEGKFTVPLQVKIVGTGFEAVAKGLEQLKAGVSGTKLVASL